MACSEFLRKPLRLTLRALQFLRFARGLHCRGAWARPGALGVILLSCDTGRRALQRPAALAPCCSSSNAAALDHNAMRPQPLLYSAAWRGQRILRLGSLPARSTILSSTAAGNAAAEFRTCPEIGETPA